MLGRVLMRRKRRGMPRFWVQVGASMGGKARWRATRQCWTWGRKGLNLVLSRWEMCACQTWLRASRTHAWIWKASWIPTPIRPKQPTVPQSLTTILPWKTSRTRRSPSPSSCSTWSKPKPSTSPPAPASSPPTLPSFELPASETPKPNAKASKAEAKAWLKSMFSLNTNNNSLSPRKTPAGYITTRTRWYLMKKNACLSNTLVRIIIWCLS